QRKRHHRGRNNFWRNKCSRLALPRRSRMHLRSDIAPWAAGNTGIAFPLQHRQKSVVSTANETQWPRRPPRLSRLFDTVRPFYFVTFNAYERQRFLARPEVHEAFCMFCLKAQEHDVAVGRYVIMPDHVHLFASLPIGGMALPGWIQSLRAVIGKRLLRLKIT